MLRSPRDRRVHVRVPATSANLGPGFDCAALALDLHDDVVVQTTTTGLDVEVRGEGATSVPRDESHLVVSSLRRTLEQLGVQQPGLKLTCINRIPQARGLGSSAAAIVAAVVASEALVGRASEPVDGEALALAAELEGHPDNVAACLYGGLTLAWAEAEGPRAVRITPSPDVTPVVFVPRATSSTKGARTLLPTHVPHLHASANSARSAILPYAVATDPSLLLAATQDWLHERYRAGSHPPTTELVQRLRDRGLPAVTSGAGPSVMVLASPRERAQLLSSAVPGWRVLPLDVQHMGAKVVHGLDLP